MRKRSFISHILVGALAALGFAACGDEEEDYPVEYGSPRVDFQVKGVVTDEDGRALNNIRVVIGVGQHADTVSRRYGLYGLGRQVRRT